MFNQKQCECGCDRTLWLYAMEARRVDRAVIYSPDAPFPLDWPGIFMWAVTLADVEETIRSQGYGVEHPVYVCPRSEYRARIAAQ